MILNLSVDLDVHQAGAQQAPACTGDKRRQNLGPGASLYTELPPSLLSLPPLASTLQTPPR